MIITTKETDLDLKKYDSSKEGKKRFVNDLLQPLFLNMDSWEKISYELAPVSHGLAPEGQEHVVMTHKNPDKSLVVNVTGDSLLSLTKDVMDAVFHKDEAVGVKEVFKLLSETPVLSKFGYGITTESPSTIVLPKCEYTPSTDLDSTSDYHYDDYDTEWIKDTPDDDDDDGCWGWPEKVEDSDAKNDDDEIKNKIKLKIEKIKKERAQK